MKHKTTKKNTYGAIRTKIWCKHCDSVLVNPTPQKKRERQRAKRLIKKTQNENS